MNSSTKRRWHWPMRAAAALVAASQLVVPFTAVAQTPQATTEIRSTASATYVDHDGMLQQAISNQVLTTIQQVGAFIVSDGVSKNGGAGSSVAVMHTITNTGNGTDKFQITVQDSVGGQNFESIDVFPDEDANGLADPGKPSLLAGGPVTDGSARTSGVIERDAGESYTYVVIYKLPITTPTWSNTATVAVKSITPALYDIPANVEVTKVDTIHLVTGAVLDATFTIGAPVGVTAAGVPTDWNPSPNSGPQGTTTTYTFTFQNNGGAAGVLYLRGDLPAGLAYQPGTAVWSSLPGQGLISGGIQGTSPNKIEFKVTGQKIEALIDEVEQNTKGTLSFRVQVGATASPGKLDSQGWYSIDSCGATDIATAATTCAPPAPNMKAEFTVTPTRGVQLGSQADGTPPAPDSMTLASARVGGAVKFTAIPVKNMGNDSDNFRLALDETAMSFPAGTVFTWYQQGGATPLQSAQVGGGFETGPVAAGATIYVELHAVLPPSTAVAAGVNYTVKALATSLNDPAKFDALNLTLNDVAPGLVDLTSTAAGSANDIGLGVLLNSVSQSLSVTAGGAGHTAAGELNATAGRAVYDLYIRNHDTGSQTFSFASSVTSTFPGNPPAGWNVAYYMFDGNSVTTSLNSVAVSEAVVSANSQVRVLAVVTPPASTSDVASQDLYFRVRATPASGVVLADQIRTQLTVVSTSTRGFTLSSAGGPRQVAAGGVVDFAYTLRNTGTLICGNTTDQLKVTATLSAAQAAADAWQAVLYKDNGTIVGQYDPSDTLMTGDMLNKLLPGAEHGLIVRVFAPTSGAPGGTSVSVVLTAEDQDGPATSCGLQTVTNTVSVSVGQLTVSKLQMLDPNCDSAAQPTASTTINNAKPGQCIVYRAKVKNNGSSAVANVTLNDSVPFFTTYHEGSVPTVSCTASGLSPAPTLAVPAVGSRGPLSCGGLTNTLNSSGEIQLQFRVRINP